MTNNEKFEYWLDTAQYDLDTAEAMLKSGRWLYVVFMCQQAIEKLVKGLYILYIDDNVPRTHNIKILVDKFEHLLPEKMTDENYDFFQELTIYYINGRYTDYKQKLSTSLGEQEAIKFHTKTKEMFEWLITLKP